MTKLRKIWRKRKRGGRSDCVYKVIYWSTRQKNGIIHSYGSQCCKSKGAAEKVVDSLQKSVDMYRIETWQKVGDWSGSIVVEDRHGNPAHLKLKNRPRKPNNGD